MQEEGKLQNTNYHLDYNNISSYYYYCNRLLTFCQCKHYGNKFYIKWKWYIILEPASLYSARLKLKAIKNYEKIEQQKYFLIHYHTSPDIKPLERISKVSVYNRTMIAYIGYSRYKDFMNDIELIIFEDDKQSLSVLVNDIKSLGFTKTNLSDLINLLEDV